MLFLTCIVVVYIVCMSIFVSKLFDKLMLSLFQVQRMLRDSRLMHTDVCPLLVLGVAAWPCHFDRAGLRAGRIRLRMPAGPIKLILRYDLTRPLRY